MASQGKFEYDLYETFCMVVDLFLAYKTNRDYVLWASGGSQQQRERKREKRKHKKSGTRNPE